jgi:hypothetical protein
MGMNRARIARDYFKRLRLAASSTRFVVIGESIWSDSAVPGQQERPFPAACTLVPLGRAAVASNGSPFQHPALSSKGIAVALGMHGEGWVLFDG